MQLIKNVHFFAEIKMNRMKDFTEAELKRIKTLALLIAKKSSQQGLAFIDKHDDFSQNQSKVFFGIGNPTMGMQKDLLSLAEFKVLKEQKIGREMFYAINKEKYDKVKEILRLLDELSKPE